MYFKLCLKSKKGVYMYLERDLLFPNHVIPKLRDLRGPEWASLVDHVMSLPESDEESLGFVLMMIRLNYCMSCETDSYWAMRGCAACAKQTLRRFNGEDGTLLCAYQQACKEVGRYIARRQRRIS